MMAKMELKKLNERERWKMEKEKRKVILNYLKINSLLTSKELKSNYNIR